MNRHLRYCLLSLCFLPLVASAQSNWTVMDMVHNNPGEPPTQTEFNSPDTLRAYGECGVDYISVGALTHSVKSLDMSFKAF